MVFGLVKNLKKLLDSMLYANIRYCLPLFANLRIEEEEPQKEEIKSLQILVNNALRMASGIKKSDKVNLEKLHELCSAKSINRIAVESVHQLMRKAMSGECLGLVSFFDKNVISHPCSTRSVTEGRLVPPAYSQGFRWQAIRTWNKFGDNNLSSKNIPF